MFQGTHIVKLILKVKHFLHVSSQQRNAPERLVSHTVIIHFDAIWMTNHQLGDVNNHYSIIT